MTGEEGSASPATTRVTAVVEFLEGEGLAYEVIEHEPTMSAASEARVTHYPPDQVAKTVVLHDGGGYMIAAIPASERLDLHKLREALGAARDLRLAAEDEIASEFPSLEVGMVPPFGPTVPAVEVIDHELLRVIVDPVAQAVTHLVVAPGHHPGLGRLVPVEMVDAVEDDGIRLRCTVADLRGFDDAEEVRFLPGNPDVVGYGEHSLMWPYYALQMPLAGAHHEAMLVDRVPLGEVEVHRGDPVHAADGRIGSVQGLVIDPEDHHVTHVLLQEGHLWGRKQVAIPIGATSRVGGEIRVGLTKQQVENLPSVELEPRT